jgi:hypothetical protein
MFQKLSLLCLIIMLSGQFSQGQITYVPGYYIDDSGNTITGFIKNTDWNKNPTNFSFKTNLESEIQNLKLDDVREFGAEELFKFIKWNIYLDTSSENMNYISVKREPEYKQLEVFLKVLIEGPVSLYEYKDENFRKYFYKVSNKDNIEPLVNKKYSSNGQTILENTDYKQQLYEALGRENIAISDMQTLKYSKTSLINFIKTYAGNAAQDDIITYGGAKNEDWFRIHIRPGLNMNSLDITDLAVSNNIIQRNFSLDTELSFRLGAQFEFILPFNSNKWALTIEPTYQSYKSSQIKDISPASAFQRDVEASVDLSSIEFSSGLRHYFFLNDEWSIFLNAGISIDIWLKQDLALRSVGAVSVPDFETDEFDSDLSFYGGIGVGFKNRYAFEINYQFNQDILIRTIDFSTDYSALSFIFSYRLL